MSIIFLSYLYLANVVANENAQIHYLSLVVTMIAMLTVIVNNLEKFVKAMKKLVDAWRKLIQDIKNER